MKISKLFLGFIITIAISIGSATSQVISERDGVKYQLPIEKDWSTEINFDKMIKDLDFITERKTIHSRIIKIQEAINTSSGINSNAEQMKEYKGFLLKLLHADLKLINKQLNERHTNSEGLNEDEIRQIEGLKSDVAITTTIIEDIKNNNDKKLVFQYEYANEDIK